MKDRQRCEGLCNRIEVISSCRINLRPLLYILQSITLFINNAIRVKEGVMNGNRLIPVHLVLQKIIYGFHILRGKIQLVNIQTAKLVIEILSSL